MDSALITVLANLGAGFIIVILMILGYLIPKPTYQRLLDENEQLKEALTLERQRSNDATQAGAVTVQLLGAITTLASERKHLEAPALDLTPKDGHL